ncbi:eukaryotic translation initiation factor 4E family protein [Tieghemostelium lacteum]|uniref:Eukaryotic translation initiation factor 4E family protein n=1 Tax=Tieghemostelium lacteum TaxID=361077 RepID=A0A151ZGK0_TIELA|nr:eukaryotic translation initiation factor 4E family protein [Tieghemostelium lacteum]|eukprot:KYQ93055.1 eukaryotic translation initiation factor 4E family protein [Tieghemostelium lacteum]
MVNYFNVLSNDDEDDDFTFIENTPSPTQPTVKSTSALTTPPNANSTQDLQNTTTQPPLPPPTNISLPVKDKQSQPHFELSFDFDEHENIGQFSESWVLWYTKKDTTTANPNATHPDENSEYLQSIQKLGSFDTLKGFKNIWDTISTPLDVNGNISVFKQGIEPAWEDVKNKDGGKYSVNYIKDNHHDFNRVLNAWFTLITTIVCSSWEHYNQTNGVVLTVRNWGASINLWNDNSDNVDSVQSLKDSLQNILRVKFCKFSSHKQSISKSKDSDGNSKKKNKLQQQQQQQPLQGGFFNNNNSGSNAATWGNLKKKLSKDSSEEIPIVKKESLLSVRPNIQVHQPVQLSSTDATNGSEDESSSPTSNSTPIVIPEIPSGVNAWSTGLLLGVPPKPKEEPQPQVTEEQPVQQQQQSIRKSNEKNTVQEKPNIPEIPAGVNAWSTGVLLPKPQPEPVKQKEEPVTVSNVEASTPTATTSENAWSSNKLLPKQQSNIIESSNIRRNHSKDNLEKHNNNSSNNNKQNENDLFWEDTSSKTSEETSKPTKVVKESKKVKEPKVPTPVPEQQQQTSPTTTTATAKVVKESKPEKKEKYTKYGKSTTTPVAQPSLWSNPQSIVQLIETISHQPPQVEEHTSTTTTTTESKEPETKVVKLEIKESKKPVDTIEVEKKPEEWTSIEKPKKTKTTTTGSADQSKISKPVPTNFEPNDKLMIRNLLVEEPLEYPSPMKPVKKEKETSTSSTTTQVNKNKVPKDKDAKKISKPKVHSTTTTTSSSSSSKKSNNTELLSPSLKMNLIAVLLVLFLGFLLKYFFA